MDKKTRGFWVSAIGWGVFVAAGTVWICTIGKLGPWLYKVISPDPTDKKYILTSLSAVPPIYFLLLFISSVLLTLGIFIIIRGIYINQS